MTNSHKSLSKWKSSTQGATVVVLMMGLFTNNFSAFFKIIFYISQVLDNGMNYQWDTTSTNNKNNQWGNL